MPYAMDAAVRVPFVPLYLMAAAAGVPGRSVTAPA